MKKNIKLIFTVVAGALLICGYGNFGCKQPPVELTITPEPGASYKSGDIVSVKVSAGEIKPDSVVYLIDSVKAGTQKDMAAFSMKTDTMRSGARLITARVFNSGKSREVSTNIVLTPAKAPVEYTYKVIKTFPHDTSSFTEGLLYQDGILYESSGGYTGDMIGQSNMHTEDLATGKVLKKTLVPPKVFAEGISIVGDKIIQLTYHEKIGYVYDKASLKLLKTFPNYVGLEGWGMCFDGKKLYMDDSTNRIFFLDKDNYRQIGYIDVYDDKGPVNQINELEYIDGKIYANVWEKDLIIVIDPKTGVVLERIDLSNLYPKDKRARNADVLNGIAYDTAGKRLFITGKKWPHLYEVEFSPLAPKGRK
jgi:glutaminyl-peptide cyclotransferase